MPEFDVEQRKGGNALVKLPYRLPHGDWKIVNALTAEEITNAVWRNYGIITLAAIELGCSLPQLYNRCDKLGIRQEIASAKEAFADKARTVLMDAMDDESASIRLRAAEAALKHSGGPQVAQQINITDGKVDIGSLFGMPDSGAAAEEGASLGSEGDIDGPIDI